MIFEIKMQSSYLIYLIYLLINGKTLNSNTALNFCNRSSWTIDSIKLIGTSNAILQSIQPGSCKEFNVPFEWDNTHGAILCNYTVFMNFCKFTRQITKGISNRSIVITDSSILPVTASARTHGNFLIVLQAASSMVDLTLMDVKSSALIKVDTWPDSSGKVIVVNYLKLRKNPILVVRLNDKRYKIRFFEKDFADSLIDRKYFYIDNYSIRPKY